MVVRKIAKAAIKVADKVASNASKVKKWIDNAVAAHAYNKASAAAKKYVSDRSKYYSIDSDKKPVSSKIAQKKAQSSLKWMNKAIDNYFKVWGKMTRNMDYWNEWRLANTSKRTAKHNLSSWVLSKKKK